MICWRLLTTSGAVMDHRMAWSNGMTGRAYFRLCLVPSALVEHRSSAHTSSIECDRHLNLGGW